MIAVQVKIRSSSFQEVLSGFRVGDNTMDEDGGHERKIERRRRRSIPRLRETDGRMTETTRETTRDRERERKRREEEEGGGGGRKRGREEGRGEGGRKRERGSEREEVRERESRTSRRRNRQRDIVLYMEWNALCDLLFLESFLRFFCWENQDR